MSRYGYLVLVIFLLSMTNAFSGPSYCLLKTSVKNRRYLLTHQVTFAESEFKANVDNYAFITHGELLVGPQLDGKSKPVISPLGKQLLHWVSACHCSINKKDVNTITGICRQS